MTQDDDYDDVDDGEGQQSVVTGINIIEVDSSHGIRPVAAIIELL